MTTKSILASALLILLLAACAPAATPPPPTPDINAIQTAAAQTVVVSFSQTAAAVPTATLEPLPTATSEGTVAPSLTPTISGVIAGPGTALLCDDADYGTPLDVTIPDGTQMTPGQEFTKTWKVKNTGACTWGTGYTVVFGYGEKMNGVPAAIATPVIPGQEVEVSVQFKAPTKVGEYKGWWRMANARNSAFGKFFSIWIIVR